MRGVEKVIFKCEMCNKKFENYVRRTHINKKFCDSCLYIRKKERANESKRLHSQL